MRKILALAATGALVAGGALVGAAQATAAQATLSIDGKTTTVRSLHDNVARVLTENGITLGSHDSVSPDLSAAANGQNIVVQYGRPLTVTIDGQTKTIWTTATTVDAALAELQLRSSNLLLSADRSMSIGREGLALNVTTQVTVTVSIPGQEPKTITIPATTVKDALVAAGVAVDADDQVSAGLADYVKDGQTLTVNIVETKQVTETVAVPFTNTDTDDATLATGTKKIKTKGVAGSAVEVRNITTVNGEITVNDLVSSTQTKAPVTQVTLVGTAAVAVAAAASGDPVTGGTTCGASFYTDTATASGIPFSAGALTAAHKTLPFGTKIRVTNVANGQTVVVTITDRGPYVGGRCLDLTPAAFNAIGNTSSGVMTVRWDYA